MSLIMLSDLIKMVRRQAKILKVPEMSTMTDCVLEKFHLALYKEIKYTDFRSAFTDIQRK